MPAEVTPRRFLPPFSKKVPWRHVKNFRQAFERSKCGVAAAAFQTAEIGAVRRRGIIRTVIKAGRAKHMAKPRLKLVTPATVKRTVTPRRRPNAELRRREHLTEAEVERLMEAAKGNRWGRRDATMILVAYRHGLRASELVDLHWDQVDFRTATLHVRRVKKGTPSTHPILGDELRALRRLQREQEPKSPFVFTSERGAPFTTAGFARMLERAGSEANAQARLRLCAGEQKPRHQCVVGLPWTPQHPAYSALYGAVADMVQKFLARVSVATLHSASAMPRWREHPGGQPNYDHASASVVFRLVPTYSGRYGILRFGWASDLRGKPAFIARRRGLRKPATTSSRASSCR
jgi:integrase